MASPPHSDPSRPPSAVKSPSGSQAAGGEMERAPETSPVLETSPEQLNDAPLTATEPPVIFNSPLTSPQPDEEDELDVDLVDSPRDKQPEETLLEYSEDSQDDQPEDAPLEDVDGSLRGDQQEDASLEVFDDSSIVADIDIVMPPPVQLTLQDENIKCVCPPGSKRLGKDLHFTGMKEGQETWVHLLCKPYTKKLSPGESSKIAEALTKGVPPAGIGSVDAAKARAAKILPKLVKKPTPQQTLMIKNFTSRFYCDGPCNGSKDFRDYFTCKKCSAWQHKPCMLYGEEGDMNGPVCNRCFMNFLFHRDEIVNWQRHRLVQAVREAWLWLGNPENKGKTERRRWATKFIGRYLNHNQGLMIKFICSRRPPPDDMASEAEEEGEGEGEGAGEEIVANEDEEVVQEPVEEPKRRKRLRRKAVPQQSEVTEQDYLELGIQPPVTVSAWPTAAGPTAEVSDDEIVVSTVRRKPSQQENKKSKEAKVKGEPTQDNFPNPPKARTKSTGKAKAPASSPPPRAAPAKRPKRKREQSTSPPLSRGNGAPRKSVRVTKRVRKGAAITPHSDEEVEQENPHIKGVDGRTSCMCYGLEPPAKDCHKCEECGLRQHKACAKDIKYGFIKLCNFCYVPTKEEEVDDDDEVAIEEPVRRARTKSTGKSVVAAPPAAIARQAAVAPPTATPRPTAPVQAPDPAIAAAHFTAVRDEILSLCSTVLWREYFLIPSPTSNDTDFDAPPEADAEPPPFPPAPWLAEMQSRLLTFITASGPVNVTKYLQASLSVFPRDKNEIMKCLRELAIHEVFAGAFKGVKRRELGIFLEVLGLEEKGNTFPIPGV